MIKVSFHKISMEKSRIWPFLTLELVEFPTGLVELGQLVESTMGLVEFTTQKHKIRILHTSFKQTSNNLIETKLGSDTTDGF